MGVTGVGVKIEEVRRDEDSGPIRVGKTTLDRESFLVSVEETEELGDGDVIRVLINENGSFLTITIPPFEAMASNPKGRIPASVARLPSSSFAFNKDDGDSAERLGRLLDNEFSILRKSSGVLAIQLEVRVSDGGFIFAFFDEDFEAVDIGSLALRREFPELLVRSILLTVKNGFRGCRAHLLEMDSGQSKQLFDGA